jgi:hypothetical protein
LASSYEVALAESMLPLVLRRVGPVVLRGTVL